MQRAGVGVTRVQWRILAAVILLGAAAAGWLAARERSGAKPAPMPVPVTAAEANEAPPVFTPLAAAPLDTPLVVTGDFGESRGGHFHAGLDLSTGERVGRPVVAPLDGWIERVRASGAGYGRSLYLHARDGRLIVFGHLDAFDEPLASYVAAVQESTGQYEQDLWPEAGRFAVAAGQRVAWSGESGAGPPHLHVEVRVGDMAYNPLEAGLEIPDGRAPAIRAIALEPIDDRSFVNRSAAVHVWSRERDGDTLVVEGRVRARARTSDGFAPERGRMAPWVTSAEFAGQRIECRFDRVSWATDMSSAEYVYDGSYLRLAVPQGPPPRVYGDRDPSARTLGAIRVGPEDAPRPLRVAARDLAGHEVERTLWLRPPRPRERGADTTGVCPGSRVRTRFEFGPLPGTCVRVTLLGAPAGSRAMKFEAEGLGEPVAASRRGSAWVAVLRIDRPWSGVLRARGRIGAHAWTHGEAVEVLPLDPSQREAEFPVGGMTWHAPAGSMFEPGLVIARDGRAAATRELRPLGRLWVLEPQSLPLKAAWSIAVTDSVAALEPARAAIYRGEGGDWSWIGGTRGADGTWRAESRGLGSFGVFEDVMAPRIVLRGAVGSRAARPYLRWALEARVRENGSGVDASSSQFTVDGVAVPSEWDAEQGILRWRPRVAPARGTHRYVVVATDRAGNASRASGRFVID